LNFVPAVLVSNKLSESSTWFSMVFQCPGIQIFPSFSIGYTASPNPSSTVSLSWSAVVVSIGYPCSPEASEMSLKDIVNCNTINMHKKTSKRILKTFQKHSKSICSNREIDSNQIHKGVSLHPGDYLAKQFIFLWLENSFVLFRDIPSTRKKMALPLHLVDLNETWEDTRNNKSKL
jgi:hypothetical protein